MPIRRLAPLESSSASGLIGILVDEFRNGDQAERPDDAPVIILQEVQRELTFQPGMRRYNVTVAWDNPQWLASTADDRYNLILEAYELANGEDSDLQIMSAVGCSLPEARSKGLLD